MILSFPVELQSEIINQVPRPGDNREHVDLFHYTASSALTPIHDLINLSLTCHHLRQLTGPRLFHKLFLNIDSSPDCLKHFPVQWYPHVRILHLSSSFASQFGTGRMELLNRKNYQTLFQLLSPLIHRLTSIWVYSGSDSTSDDIIFKLLHHLVNQPSLSSSDSLDLSAKRSSTISLDYFKDDHSGLAISRLPFSSLQDNLHHLSVFVQYFDVQLLPLLIQAPHLSSLCLYFSNIWPSFTSLPPFPNLRRLRISKWPLVGFSPHTMTDLSLFLSCHRTLEELDLRTLIGYRIPDGQLSSNVTLFPRLKILRLKNTFMNSRDQAYLFFSLGRSPVETLIYEQNASFLRTKDVLGTVLQELRSRGLWNSLKEVYLMKNAWKDMKSRDEWNWVNHTEISVFVQEFEGQWYKRAYNQRPSVQ